MNLVHPQFKRITINPQVCFGKPCIRGLRFPVSTLLGYLSGGTTFEKLLEEFPFLENDDILEAIAFAASIMENRFIPLEKAA